MKSKQQYDDKVVTRGILREELKCYATKEDVREILDDKLKDYPTKEDFLQFRSDIFSKFDQVIGQYAQIQEDKIFIEHDIRQLKKTDADHENRIKELEKQAHN
ncbi:MAG: hypothetical protein AAB553_05670 [Patescibacteria group bacterium]